MRGTPRPWLASWRRSRRHRRAARSFRHRTAREQLSLGARNSTRPLKSHDGRKTGGGPPEFFLPSKTPSAPVHRAQAALFLQPPNPAKRLSPDFAAAAPKHATSAQHSRGLRRQIAAQPAARRGLRRTCPHARALGADAGARRLRRAWPRTAATISQNTTGSGLNQSQTLDIVPRVAAPLVQEFIQRARWPPRTPAP